MTKDQFIAALAADGRDIDNPSSVVADQHGAIMTWEWEPGHKSYCYAAYEDGLGSDKWSYVREDA